jgi:hypothetical protein
MWNRRVVCLVFIAAGVVGCATTIRGAEPVSAKSPRGNLDDLCRDAGPDSAKTPLDTFQVGSGLVSFEKPWFAQPRSNSHLLELTLGVRGMVSVTHDMSRPWPRQFAPSGIECELVRGIDTVLVRGRIESSLVFSVEALWDRPSDQTQLYLRMVTAIPAELRKIRRTIETARFPVPESVAAMAR